MPASTSNERGCVVKLELRLDPNELFSFLLLAEHDGADLERTTAAAVRYFLRVRGFSSEIKALNRAQQILGLIADKSGLEVSILISGWRKRDYVAARHAAMFLVYEYTSLSYPAVARLFGGRDHSTVIHACRKVRSTSNSDILWLVRTVEEELGLSQPVSA